MSDEINKISRDREFHRTLEYLLNQLDNDVRKVVRKGSRTIGEFELIVRRRKH